MFLNEYGSHGKYVHIANVLYNFANLNILIADADRFIREMKDSIASLQEGNRLILSKHDTILTYLKQLIPPPNLNM